MARPRRWPLWVRLPRELGLALQEAARRRGLSRNGLVALLLTRAAGFQLEALEAAFRLELSVDGVRTASPLDLLSRGMAVPLRPDGIYSEAELAGFLGVSRGVVIRWIDRGWLEATRVERRFAYISGRDALEFLVGQSLRYVEAVSVLRLAPVG